MNTRYLRVGVYGILRHNEKILMVPTQSGSKKIFNFPGGGVEQGEGLEEGLIRECHEEIGLDVNVDKFLYMNRILHIHKDFSQFYMFGVYYQISPKNSIDLNTHTLNDAQWFAINELPIEKMLSIDQEVCEFLFTRSEE